MKKITSKLENTYIKGVLIKKGENSFTDEDFETVNKSPVFQTYIRYGHVSVSETKEKPAKNTLTTDFDKMSYNELVSYAKKNNLKPKTNKKADILAEIKKMKEGK